ncbi:MAG: DUF945 domain-containing protein [Proteobacteria bacterium]|nr:DUF945 domain-containing protein [Pseudomonadota bacterium]
MNTNPTLATRFARATRVLRAEIPLGEDQMRQVAPSVFAGGKHTSRSDRYTYIPTIDVLRGLRREGFEPYMVAQGQSRIEGKTEYTKHLVRLRHVSEQNTKAEANEIILINSHDGASCYQLLAGQFRFVCCNGLILGDASHDIRIPHKGDVRGDVIEGAFRVLDDFEVIGQSTEAMKAIELAPDERQAFARAALTVRFGERTEGQPPAPITTDQLLEARRVEDEGASLWLTFNRIQANAVQGGQLGRGARGRRTRTRGIRSIDGDVSLNRALWQLAEEMRQLKS